MKKLGTNLASLVSRLGLDDAARLHGIKARWGDLVGSPLSDHLEPAFVAGAMLHIAVESPLWLEQARFYNEEILKRVKPLGIGELKFKPGVRRGNRNNQSLKKNKEVTLRPLTDDELKQIELSIFPVRDDGLKEIMRGIMAKALRAPAK